MRASMLMKYFAGPDLSGGKACATTKTVVEVSKLWSPEMQVALLFLASLAVR